MTLNAVATALVIELREAVLTAEGDLDSHGTLGVSRQAPVGFQASVCASSWTPTPRTRSWRRY